MSHPTYDYIIIGSGFGGSVSAMRLTEKGYSVLVLEKGKRFEDKDFAKSNWQFWKYLWLPALRAHGILQISILKGVMVLHGAGVGGGSLVYANTLYEPLDPFYKDPAWGHITDWKQEMAPYYDQAKRMLGVVDNPVRTPSDDVMEKVANDLGVGDTFHPTPVGVFFGGPDAQRGEHVEDPYFGGAGPDRDTCIACGSCMTGCRYNAKNTLMKNYLYLAEQRGAKVMALTTVTRVEPSAADRCLFSLGLVDLFGRKVVVDNSHGLGVLQAWKPPPRARIRLTSRAKAPNRTSASRHPGSAAWRTPRLKVAGVTGHGKTSPMFPRVHTG